MNIGLKVGNSFYSFDRKVSLFSSSESIDFIEYKAPHLDVHYFSKFYDVPINKLRPHSIYISTAHDKYPCDRVLDVLSYECSITETPYLGEHIGYLNEVPTLPSFDYLLAPPLNKKTIENIATNVFYIEKHCGVPVALENPVIYYKHPESTMAWPEFVRALSQELPSQTGWLIDIAHLIISSKNLNEWTLSETLQAYAETKRVIYELHVADVQKDSLGIFHDSHSSHICRESISNNYLDMFFRMGLSTQNVTLERDCHTQEQLFEAKYEASRLRERKWVLDPACEVSIVIEHGKRIAQEERGRLNILIMSLRKALTSFSTDELEELAKELSYSTFALLVDSYRKSFRDSDASEVNCHVVWGAVSLLPSFYEYIAKKLTNSPKGLEYKQKLLLELSIAFVAFYNEITHEEFNPSIVLEFAEGNIFIPDGKCIILVRDDDIVVEGFDKNKHKGLDTILVIDIKGGLEWNKRAFLQKNDLKYYARGVKKLLSKALTAAYTSSSVSEEGS